MVVVVLARALWPRRRRVDGVDAVHEERGWGGDDDEAGDEVGE
jgi:hypothetical protein